MTLNIAYLAAGKLHLKLVNDPVRTIDSEFGQSVQERAQQIRRRNAWKAQGQVARMLFPGMTPEADEVPRVAITGLCRGQQGKLFYTLEAGSVAGIFSLDQSSINEQRLFHNADFGVRHLAFHPSENLIACSILHEDGTSNIAMMNVDGARPNEVTEGDSVDLAPTWIPNAERALVFQSAGLGRDRSGLIREQSPFTIEKLDFGRQEMTCLAAEPKHDLLGPKLAADGTLYYIRRPYKPFQRSFNLLHLLRDILLIPFRLLFAIFQWLNFFTARYTGKPLMVGGRKQSPDFRRMMIWGNLVDAEEAAKRSRFGDEDAPALVPRSWQLIRQRSGGYKPETIGEGVLSFDVGEDGTIIYTNGSAIYHLAPNGKTERILVDNLIEQVIFANGNE